ncbi:LysM peptidoglycan-binding domain-containing protein [Kangiella sp. TOML190]|uniref:LysM peptidoglycan-binding domain-containing protein n=1 Tax=Kangiella sp. TOML190 TaxID=2931351 RepID=UPI0020423706|nr:LysM peptidoglycan-binding domain-containing protein [Kangiella sp. TOML190]
MKKLLVSVVASATLILGAIANTATAAELRADHPDTYVVKKGDTLWDISGRFLQKPWKWPEIWHVNPEIANPHLIYPGDILKLVYIDGKPYLVKASDGTIKLRPKARVLSEGDAITTIPLDLIKPYLTDELVMDESAFANTPYVVAHDEERAMSGGMDDRMYVRGLNTERGASYGVYRKGKVYQSPGSEEILGVEARYLANGVISRAGDPASLDIKKSKLEVLKGDLVLPRNEDPLPPVYAPRGPDFDINANIISVYDGVTQIGQYNVVVLDKGARDGMQEGHVLSVYKKGKLIHDKIAEERGAEKVNVVLPEERAGELMVFRTFDKVSLALIMGATRPIHILDVAKNPY